MNWKVFKRNDPNTHPEINCPMIVYKPYDSCFTLDVHYFDSERKRFYQKEGGNAKWYKNYDECYYSYITRIPYLEKEVQPIKCNLECERCEYEDDGYCLCEEKCHHQREVTEYILGSTKIWKEFEEL